MNTPVRIVAIIASGLVVIVMCLTGMGYAIHAGNVKVAEACVASGGSWTLVKETTANEMTEIERACVRN